MCMLHILVLTFTQNDILLTYDQGSCGFYWLSAVAAHAMACTPVPTPSPIRGLQILHYEDLSFEVVVIGCVEARVPDGYEWHEARKKLWNEVKSYKHRVNMR